MGALLYHPALIHHQDEIGTRIVLDGRATIAWVQF